MNRVSNNMFRDAADVIKRTAPLDPVYLYCEEVLQHRAQQFLDGFPGMTTYALKANPCDAVLAGLKGVGIRGYDVASIGEVERIYRFNPDAVMHFNNPIKTMDAIKRSYHDYGVRSFAVDDRVEMEKLKSVVVDPAEVEISVRFKLEKVTATFNLSSKFGASSEEAVALLQDAASHGFMTSLTFHPGSQCTDPDSYRRYIMAASDIVKTAGVNLHRLNVGGGFPDQYAEFLVPELEIFFAEIHRAAHAAFGDNIPPLVCEPGRGMVTRCISLLTRVTHKRESAVVYLNDGIFGGLLEQAYAGATGQMQGIKLPVKVWRDGQLLCAETEPMTVFGPTCDSIDCLPYSIDLPTDINADDYIEFGMLGAYGSSTATEFNGFSSKQYVQVEQGFEPVQLAVSYAA